VARVQEETSADQALSDRLDVTNIQMEIVWDEIRRDADGCLDQEAR
jgi:hypothetical protein